MSVARSRLALLPFMIVTMVGGWGAAFGPGAANGQDTTQMAKRLIADHEKSIRPIEIESSKAWWEANVTGSDAAYEAKQAAENRLDAALANRERFAALKKIEQQGLSDSLLARQIHVLYLQALAKQVDPDLLRQMVARQNGIEKAFNVFRAKVGDRELPDSEVRVTLKESKKSADCQAAWEASKGVGAVVEAELKTLVSLRNQAARQLGFADFHVMQMELNEQKQNQVLALFDELDDLTRGPFLAVKAEIDAHLTKDFGLSQAELRPWHYRDPFFQESPAIYATNLDAVYAKVDIMDACRRFYAGIDLPIEDVLARSSLYEQPGKSPHAFCTDIDREGDVRVLANVVGNEYWMGTMLHELGHAVYSSKNIPKEVPYVLREASHTLTTEGVAMMFERFSKSADWLERMGVKVENPTAFNETGRKLRRNRLLIFSRWCQVMLRFEKEMYRDPDQDLNKLWWDLVEKYQGLTRPEGRNAPDYASKIHIVSAPVYYHNYMLGELFACQVNKAIMREVLKTDDTSSVYVDDKRVGAFMREKVFAPGRVLSWNDLTRHATGEELNAKAFAADFGAK